MNVTFFHLFQEVFCCLKICESLERYDYALTKVCEAMMNRERSEDGCH